MVRSPDIAVNVPSMAGRLSRRRERKAFRSVSRAVRSEELELGRAIGMGAGIGVGAGAGRGEASVSPNRARRVHNERSIVFVFRS